MNITWKIIKHKRKKYQSNEWSKIMTLGLVQRILKSCIASLILLYGGNADQDKIFCAT